MVHNVKHLSASQLHVFIIKLIPWHLKLFIRFLLVWLLHLCPEETDFMGVGSLAKMDLGSHTTASEMDID